MQFLISTSGIPEIEAKFQRFEKNVTEAEATMTEVGELIDKYVKKNWGRGVKDAPSTDARWPNHQALVNPEAAQSRGLPQLRDTFRVREITPVSVTYGSDDYRARFLQYGTKKMAKKRVLKIPRKAIKALLQRRIFEGF